MGQKYKHAHIPPNASPVSGPAGAAVALGVFVGWLLRKGKRAKGMCWHNTFTNNCLLLLLPQGKHFMEMTGYEGQRCEEASGKISFLDSATMSYQHCTLSACSVSPRKLGSHASVCLWSHRWKAQRWIVENKLRNCWTNCVCLSNIPIQ